jgi:[ribosomal protein S5]-alanine N-acetyltransferase
VADETAELPTLTGSRLRLRQILVRDVPSLFAVFSDPAVMRYWSRPPMTHLDEALKLLENIDSGRRDGTLYQWGIAMRGDDRVIGTCTLFALNREHRRAEIGYALGSAHWGQGLAFEALRLSIAFAFSTMRLNRLEADVDPRNTPSLRLLERLGFVREGTLRERWRVNGEVQDSALFGLLAADFPAR